MKWGLYDPMDRCWYGDVDGPKLYDDEGLARIAATVLFFRFEQKRRVEVREYDGTGTKLRDEVTAPVDALTALKRAEGEDV